MVYICYTLGDYDDEDLEEKIDFLEEEVRKLRSERQLYRYGSSPSSRHHSNQRRSHHGDYYYPDYEESEYYSDFPYPEDDYPEKFKRVPEDEENSEIEQDTVFLSKL